MPLTTLDPKTALIVIDLQKGIAAREFLHPLATVISNTRTLLDAFRSAGLPVVLVNVTGRPPGRTEQGPRASITPTADWAELISELSQQPSDLLVTKQAWSAFALTGLEQQLKSHGVTQVVVTGLVTSGGVEATARQAFDLGFHVTLALDAMTDLTEDAHNHAVHKVFPRIGESGTTQQILELLAQRKA